MNTYALNKQIMTTFFTHKKAHFLLVLITSLLSLSAFASSPIGQWITLDDWTKKPTGIVDITEHQGKLYGKIIAGFGVDPLKFCQHCPGNLNNQPVIGLTFLWGFVPDKENKWIDGHILDPHTGKIYRGSIMLVNNGNELKLRGYWGIFFRTETWIHKTS